MPSTLSVATYGLGGGIGLLLMGYATMTYLWYGYQKANPAIGTISTSPGFEVVTALLFLVGTVIAFTAFSKGLARIVTEIA